MSFRIGLMGGSFNPVHNGHIEIAHSFINSGFIDQLWVYPTPDPPHKIETKLVSFHHRFEMLKLAMKSLNQAVVSVKDIESNLPRPNYTLKTIEYLIESYPEHTFFLCIGSDSLASFTKWYKYERILSLIRILVAYRPEFNKATINPELLDTYNQKINFIKHEEIEISSTTIRKDIYSDTIGYQIPKEVEKYIRDNGLYEN